MPEKPEPFIRVRGLHQQFGANHILKGIDLDVYHGENLVIIGTSGCGKSVLVKHFPRLLIPTRGSVQVNGTEITTLHERALGPIRREMGFMFQGGALFDSMTVGENIAFPLREQGMKDEAEIAKLVARALDTVHLPGIEPLMPSDLSGGMRKRVSLARAFVDSPSCVLYDEPHSGLDPVTADSIDHLINHLRDDHSMTNIVITHGIQNMFNIADRVAFLDDGKVRFCGTPDELRASDDAKLQHFIAGKSTEEH